MGSRSHRKKKPTPKFPAITNLTETINNAGVMEEISPQELMRQHLTDAMFNEVFNCNQCSKQFTNKSNLSKHLDTHSTVRHPCDMCNETFKTRTTYLRHKRNVHATTDRLKVKCNYCNKRFLFPSKLKDHERVHTGAKPYKCKECGKSFSALYSLQGHMLIHTDEKPFECKYCSYKCRDSSTLRKHQRRHEGRKEVHACNLCDKTYSKNQALEAHVTQDHHNINTKVVCDICKQSYRNKVSLKTHILYTHQKKTCLNCPICNKYISRMGNFRLHLATHSKNRPMVRCDFDGCNKKYKCKRTLAKHSKIHYPDEQYECNECNRKFTRKERLAKHIKIIHNVVRKKRVKCRECGQKFYSKNYLPRHMRTVHGHMRKSDIKEHKGESIDSSSPVFNIKQELFDEEETVIQAINNAEEMQLNITFDETKDEVMSHNSKMSGELAKSLNSDLQEPESIDEFLARNLIETTDVVKSVDLTQKEGEIAQNKSLEMGKELDNSEKDDLLEDEELEIDETFKKSSGNEENSLGNSENNETFGKAESHEDNESPEKDLNCDDIHDKDDVGTQKGIKPKYLTYLEKRKEKRRIRKETMLKEREELAGARREYNERIMEIAEKMAKRDQEKSPKDMVIEKQDSNVVSASNGNTNNKLKMTIKNGKVEFNMHQCYVCFKLFDTKQKLLEHCSEHFDICNIETLRKCPLCDYASTKYLKRHLLKKHNLTVRMQNGHIPKIVDGKYTHDLVYTTNKEIKSLEIIPSVKNLNKISSMKFDRERRNLKQKGTIKTNLVKNGTEWVVEKDLQIIDYKHYLLPLDKDEKIHENSMNLDYLDKMTRLNNLAKKEGYKILYPCDNCDQVCTGLAALKAHYNIHKPRPKTKRPHHALTLAHRNPNKVRKTHKEMKSFFEKYVKGSDMDFLEFSRAFDSVDALDGMED